MIFTDDDFVKSADMTALDSQVTAVARTETITIDGPGGIAAQACDEVGQKLLGATQSFSGGFPPFNQPYNQSSQVLNLVGPAVNRARIALSQVVVSPDNPTESAISNMSALKRYAVYRALQMLYRTAYFRKMEDRYEKRMTMYSEEIRKVYWPRCFNRGVPVVYKPLACPGALHEFNAGVFDATHLATVAGTNAIADAFYDVAITWVDQSAYVSPAVKGNSESAPSRRQDITIAINTVLAIDITGLNGPNGTNPLNVGMGQSLIVPGNTTGWNIYVGLQGSALYLQNPTPIPISTKTFTLPGAPVLSGHAADSGQFPEVYLTMQATMARG